MNILIAEDNAFTAAQYAKALHGMGHHVTISRDGEECIQVYENSLGDVSPFDVVLLDNNMPKRSGVEVAKEILGKNPAQRIIFASAYNLNTLLKSPGTIPKTIEVLEKPFSLSTMIRAIEA
jgi:CheY-like chemotaxis protein